MTTLANKVTNQRVFIWLVTIVGILLSPVLAWAICFYGYQMALIALGLVIVAGWAFMARDHWWVPFPASIVMSGTFYYGFKIPMHEMTLLICLLPLALALSTRWQGAIPGRRYPDSSVFLLTFYLIVHCLGSLIYNKMHGLGGAHNVIRSYMSALWPMILFFTFYFFGNSKYIRTAFFLMYCAALLRFILGVISYFYPAFTYIPGINYVPPTLVAGGVTAGGGDLRVSCVWLATLSLCYFLIKRGRFLRLFNFLTIIACAIFIVFGGGRLTLLNFAAVFIYLAFIYRNFLFLFLLGLVFSSMLLFLNLNSQVLESLPQNIQRSLSGYILKPNSVSAQEMTEGSTQWHHQLAEAGKKRWLQTPTSIMVGHGMRPFNAELWTGDFEDQMKVAEGNGAYESSYWTILTVTGLVGLILYLNVFRFLLWDSLPLLWRHGVHDYQSALVFMTSYNIVWLIAFGWISGGFPSVEIMFGLLAKTLHDDQKWQQKEAEKVDSIPH